MGQPVDGEGLSGQEARQAPQAGGTPHAERGSRAASTASMDGPTPSVHTASGDFPLYDYRARIAGRDWSILHTETILSHEDEQRFLSERESRPPYGVALWPSSIALAHELASRAEEMRGVRILELGAGTGLPGMVAASLGARVVQTDRQELALFVCRGNGERNGARDIDYRLADWTQWEDDARYDFIIGADILYGESMQPHLRRIFETNLAPSGRILLADPFRTFSVRMLEAMEADGWRISMSKWSIGEDASPRAIGVFELVPPTA